MITPSLTTDLARILRLLCRLRLVAVLAYALGLAAAALLGLGLPAALWLLPPALLGFDHLARRRLAAHAADQPKARDSARRPAPAAVSAAAGEAVITRHLGIDALALFVFLWATGGATSPFVSLFLVPVALASVALSPTRAFALTAGCILGYSLLLWRYLGGHAGHAGMGGFAAHVVGMWLNFVIAASLLCVFLLAVAAALRAREQEIARQRERLLRDDAIVSVATLAAGAAHALNTPLSSIAVAAESLQARKDLPADARAEIETVQSQAGVCAAALRELVAAHRNEPRETLALSEFAAAVRWRWRSRRPEIETRVAGEARLPELTLREDPALAQALHNLLDNAADASLAAETPMISMTWSVESRTQAGARRDWLVLAIDDAGSPSKSLGSELPTDSQASTHIATRASTKASGLGLGITLAQASIARLGGRLYWQPAPAGGTRTGVELPCDALIATGEG